MRVAIFGLSGCGKSTLFRALQGGAAGTGKSAGVCTLTVPDERVEVMARLYNPRKVTHVAITFEEVDPGGDGPVSGEAPAKIRNGEVLALVLRNFANDFHPAPPEGLDPLRDFRKLEADLATADYLVAQKRLERLEKEKKRDLEWSAVGRAVEYLEKEIPLRTVEFSAEEQKALSGFRFLTLLPLVAVENVGEGEVEGATAGLAEAVAERGGSLVRLCARIEEEVAELPPEEQGAFLSDLGIAESARDRLVRAAYDAMQYITFLTVGEDEVRAWTVRRGATAPVAAGRIHSDLEKGFIRAEVVHYDDLARLGSMAKAKAEGKFRLEGKEYVVRDGDIVHVRFNV
jgi:GTP-binding protein YchF